MAGPWRVHGGGSAYARTHDQRRQRRHGFIPGFILPVLYAPFVLRSGFFVLSGFSGFSGLRVLRDLLTGFPVVLGVLGVPGRRDP
jgi:hypothetical protein